MQLAMDGGKGVVPRRPGLMDAWIRVLDAVVRVLTFGRGRGGARAVARTCKMGRELEVKRKELSERRRTHKR